MRFELGYYALKPDVKVVAPWRIWDLNSRTKLCAYAEENGLDVPMSKQQEVRASSRPPARRLRLSRRTNRQTAGQPSTGPPPHMHAMRTGRDPLGAAARRLQRAEWHTWGATERQPFRFVGRCAEGG